MAYQFDFNSTYGILRCRFEGDVTDESLKECYKASGEYVAFTNPNVAIMDFSNASSLNVSSQTVRDLANRAPSMSGSQPRFLVAPSPSLYGMARMFQQYGSETRPQMHVVRSMDEVYAILGVEEPHFEPVTRPAAIRKRQTPMLAKSGGSFSV